jgi:hypothetical protein
MYRSLDPEKTIATLRTLSNRIEERFPGASLNRVCIELLSIAEETTGRINWLSRPHAWIRIAVFVVIGFAMYLGWQVLKQLKVEAGGLEIQDLEAAANAVFLLGAALLFLVTLESRIKRSRVLSAVNELRAISHVIDMHQLTKDPSQVIVGVGHRTPSSPKRTLTAYQLTRYLDYCTEMLSLVGKLAALYAQSNSDSVVLQSVNDIETLTNGISRKIWQKIMILDNDLKPDPELLKSTLSTELSMESSTEAAAAADVFVTENVSPEKKRLPISEPKR